MHTLHIQLKAKVSALGQNVPEIDSPVIAVPIADPIGQALEMGLELVPDRAADGNAEVIAKGSLGKIRIAHIFGRDINVEGTYELDAEVWVTSDDPAVIAVADAKIAEAAK